MADLSDTVILDFGTDHWYTPSSEQRQANYVARREGSPEPHPGSRLIWVCAANEVDVIWAAFHG